MKHYELVEIAKYISCFKKIYSAQRVDDTIIEFVFDKEKPMYANLKRGKPTWFMKSFYTRNKIYQAPFDILLHKHFANSYIQNVDVQHGNRIMSLHVSSKNKYKTDTYTLMLEFTGRNTNAIILNDEKIVLEALRHIDKSISFRQVVVGEPLSELPPRTFNEEKKNIDDIPSFLKNIYEIDVQQRLDELKRQKIKIINKKKFKLEKQLEKLQSEKNLLNKATKLSDEGTLVLANLSCIKPYTKDVKLIDFEGKEQHIVFPKEAKSPQNAANILFSASKKMKQKAQFIHIQRENLQDKIRFFEHLIKMIQSTNGIDEVNILAPKQKNTTKKTETNDIYETFFMEGYKIMIGKSEKSNIQLLKIAKKNDIWLHLKDIPSSHVIIRTNKQQIPQKVLEFGAKLCVYFSKVKDGHYIVDYTKRQNVRIENGANVFYTDFKSIQIDTDEKIV